MTMSKMYDEYHEYRVDTQRWTKWPKALIMTHEWSTNGHDRRLEQRRYVPDNYATQLEMENSRIKAHAEYQKKVADEELDEVREIRHNITRLRERVHEIAADRDRIKAENAKLREMVRDVGHLLFAIDADYCAACPRDSINHPCPVHTVGSGECLYKADIRELGIETDDV